MMLSMLLASIHYFLTIRSARMYTLSSSFKHTWRFAFVISSSFLSFHFFSFDRHHRLRLFFFFFLFFLFHCWWLFGCFSTFLHFSRFSLYNANSVTNGRRWPVVHCICVCVCVFKRVYVFFSGYLTFLSLSIALGFIQYLHNTTESASTLDELFFKAS